MSDWERVGWCPCFCVDCQSLVTVNLRADDPRCPTCGSTSYTTYDDPLLNDRSSTQAVASWNVRRDGRGLLVLTRSRHFCPRCREMSLMFRLEGLGD